ncbi:MAG: DUF5683 domain-containing protein [Bacteroidota bacterium]
MKAHFLLLFLLAFSSQYAIAQVQDSTQQLTIVPDAETKLVINDTTRVLETDSILLLEQSLNDDYPIPKKAAKLGLIIPGAGHIYNKKGWWWKLPIVYGGIAAGVYFFDDANQFYNFFDDVECYKIIENSRDLSQIAEASRCGVHLQLAPNSTEDMLIYEINRNALSNASKRRIESFDGYVEADRFSREAMRSRRNLYDKRRQAIGFGMIAGHLVLNGAWPFVDAHLRNFDLNDDLTLKFRPMMQNVPLTSATYAGLSAQLEF